jgi:hypothetical protein
VYSIEPDKIVFDVPSQIQWRRFFGIELDVATSISTAQSSFAISIAG